MAASYQVEETSKQLFIRVKRQHALAAAVAESAATALFIAFVVHRLAPIAVVISSALLGAILAFVWFTRENNVELRITNLELITKGYFGGEYRSVRQVSAADIHWLEYQEEQVGPEADRPGGMYAKLKWSRHCVLPYLDEAQTNELIERIYAKYPSLTSNSDGRRTSALEGHFTTIGLDKRK